MNFKVEILTIKEQKWEDIVGIYDSLDSALVAAQHHVYDQFSLTGDADTNTYIQVRFERIGNKE
jgi:hypothetical protein